MTFNMTVVSATANTGQGYAQFDAFVATLNMSIMANGMYQDVRTSVFHYIHTMALEGMMRTDKKERRLAIERDDVNRYGCAKVAVMADGAWSHIKLIIILDLVLLVIFQICVRVNKIKIN